VTVSDLPFTSNAVPDTVTATGPVFVAVMSIAACPSWRPYTGTLNDVVTVSRARRPAVRVHRPEDRPQQRQRRDADRDDGEDARAVHLRREP